MKFLRIKIKCSKVCAAKFVSTAILTVFVWVKGAVQRVVVDDCRPDLVTAIAFLNILLTNAQGFLHHFRIELELEINFISKLSQFVGLIEHKVLYDFSVYFMLGEQVKIQITYRAPHKDDKLVILDRKV